MFTIQKIPHWMKPFISVLTDGAYTTIEELTQRCDEAKSWEAGTVVVLNQRINLLASLREKGLLKVNIKKPITEVHMGEIFKIYEGQERYFTLSSTKIWEENGSHYISIREYTGGTGHHMSSAWLLQEDRCHADIEVEVVPALPEAFHMK